MATSRSVPASVTQFDDGLAQRHVVRLLDDLGERLVVGTSRMCDGARAHAGVGRLERDRAEQARRPSLASASSAVIVAGDRRRDQHLLRFFDRRLAQPLVGIARGDVGQDVGVDDALDGEAAHARVGVRARDRGQQRRVVVGERAHGFGAHVGI